MFINELKTTILLLQEYNIQLWYLELWYIDTYKSEIVSIDKTSRIWLNKTAVVGTQLPEDFKHSFTC
jgi:hypothetical protein